MKLQKEKYLKNPTPSEPSGPIVPPPPSPPGVLLPPGPPGAPVFMQGPQPTKPKIK